MSDALDTDLFDELDTAEGMAEYDELDELDELDEGEDDFLGGLLGGAARVPGGGTGGANAADDWEGDGFDADEGYDALEDSVADALEEEDADAFFRRLRSVARRVGRVARGVGRGIGAAARVVGPLASMIPLPQAQLIGRLANVAGRLMADGADEAEAFDELMDFAEEEDAIDAAAPFVSAVAIRRVMPQAGRLSRPARRQLVRSVSRAVRTIGRQQGPAAARAVQPIVRSVGRAVRNRTLPVRAAPRAIARAAAQVARRPAVARRLAQRATPAAARSVRAGRPLAMTCAHCRRRMMLRGPVTITVTPR